MGVWMENYTEFGNIGKIHLMHDMDINELFLRHSSTKFHLYNPF